MFTNECPLLSGTFFFQQGKFKQTPTVNFFRGMSLVFRGALVITLLFLEPFLGGVYQKIPLGCFSGWNSQEICRFSSSTGGKTNRFHQLGWLEVSDAHADPARRHPYMIPLVSKQKTRRVNNKHMNFLRPPILPKKIWVLLWLVPCLSCLYMFILFVCANSRFPLPHLELGELCPGGLEKTSRTFTRYWVGVSPGGQLTAGTWKWFPPKKKEKHRTKPSILGFNVLLFVGVNPLARMFCSPTRTHKKRFKIMIHGSFLEEKQWIHV